MNAKSRVLRLASAFVLLASVIMASMPIDAQVSPTEHVYYGYVPPSTDIAAGETAESNRPAPGEVDEIIRGTVTNYTVPSGVAILDIAGLVDGTTIEIWDIYANQRIHSATVNRLEKKFFYIPFGTFFKIIASNRIAALLNGGSSVFEPEGWDGGISTFYPAVTGGFRGKEFIFNAAPGTHPYGYSMDVVGYNFYLFALQEADWSLSDAADVWSTSDHLGQRRIRTIILQSRKHHLEYHNGAGHDVVYRLTTSGDAEVLSCATGGYIVVPAITGGYIGRLFYAPVTATWGLASEHAATFIVVPLEEGQVTIYDRDLKVVATRSFTASDVEDRNYWYHSLGLGRFDLIVESTGDVAFMVGETEGMAEIGYLGDDIAFIGSKPGQEIRFYAPTMAVVFAPEPLTISIDDGVPVEMAKDEFKLLESGVHSISADKHVIVEILAAGEDWDNWGSYLIEPDDIDVSFDVPQGFVSKPVDYTMYIAAAVIGIVVVLAVLMMRRRRARQV